MTADTQASQGEQDNGTGTEGELEPKECRFCDVAPAVLGLAAAAVIVFVSLDLLKGGALTVWALRLFGRGAVPDDDAKATD